MVATIAILSWGGGGGAINRRACSGDYTLLSAGGGGGRGAVALPAPVADMKYKGLVKGVL